jgi:photosystem II stability/assembly factor-like uncharacterized protein
MKKYLYFPTLALAAALLSGCTVGSLSSAPKAGTVSTISSVMKSTDAGKKWEPKNKTADKISLGAVDVLSVAINPFDGRNVYVGTVKNGIVKTDDGGETWSLLNFPAQKVYGLAVDSSEGHTLYATGVWQDFGKIFKSVNSGKDWDEIYTAPSKGPLVISLTIDRSRSSVLYAGTSDKQVMKSVDGGASWQNMFSAPGPITKIALDSVRPELMYAQVFGGDVLKSSDGGKTFSVVSANVSGGSETVEADPINSGVLYVGGRAGLFKSKDAGANWEKLKTLNVSANFPITAIAINPSNPGEMLYGAAQAVYRSADNGQSWSPVQLETKKTVSVIRYDAGNANTIFLGLRDK